MSECTPRYIGHDIDSEMASNLRMLCLVVLLLRLVNFLGKVIVVTKCQVFWDQIPI